MRYDPWGSLKVASGAAPDLGFQRSWFDANTGLAWAVNRWYVADLGTFASEDAVLGVPEDPSTRHLYAYGAGDPVGRWDPEGNHWYIVRSGDTLWTLAQRFYSNGALLRRITSGNPGGRITAYNLNHARATIHDLVGKCIWIPFTQLINQCNKARGDSVAAGNILWGRRFDPMVTYVAKKMRERSFNEVGGLGTVSWWVPGNINIWIRWAQLVREGGPWDIKHDIEKLWGHSALFWTAVRDDPAPESFRVDLLGLIHYGYVGRAHGIGSVDLRVGNAWFGGVQGDDDNFALELGMDMWRVYGHDMTYDNLRHSVLSTLRTFRRFGDALKPPLHL